jgi:hypothetical protein
MYTYRKPLVKPGNSQKMENFPKPAIKTQKPSKNGGKNPLNPGNIQFITCFTL